MPGGWRVQQYGPVCMIQLEATIITNYDTDLPYRPPAPSCNRGSGYTGLPDDFVVVEIGHSEGRLNTNRTTTEPDTRLPLKLEDLQASPVPNDPATRLTKSLIVDGESGYFINVFHGPGATTEDIDRVRAIVASAYL